MATWPFSGDLLQAMYAEGRGRRYLQQVPGARPHIPVDQHSPMADFEAIAPRYPFFRVSSAPAVLGAAIPPG